jgi:hypothetical protein
MTEHPVPIATALTGLLVALGAWGIATLPADVPGAVALALGALLLSAAGLVGKFTERFTARWTPGTVVARPGGGGEDSLDPPEDVSTDLPPEDGTEPADTRPGYGHGWLNP